MPNGDPRDRFFYPSLTFMVDFYSLDTLHTYQFAWVIFTRFILPFSTGVRNVLTAVFPVTMKRQATLRIQRCISVHLVVKIGGIEMKMMITETGERQGAQNGVSFLFKYSALICQYSKTCVKRPLSKRPKLFFQDQLSLNTGQKYCRML